MERLQEELAELRAPAAPAAPAHVDIQPMAQALSDLRQTAAQTTPGVFQVHGDILQRISHICQTMAETANPSVAAAANTAMGELPQVGGVPVDVHLQR